VTKRDLWDHYPDGLRAVPLEDVVCVHGSSGTGGRPTLVPYTAEKSCTQCARQNWRLAALPQCQTGFSTNISRPTVQIGAWRCELLITETTFDPALLQVRRPVLDALALIVF
jgi:phenylacetate-coenzyme A ligase PaaK-like adenylate-forming protein